MAAYNSRMEFFLICFLAIVLIMVAMYFGSGPVSGASAVSKLSGEPYEGFTDAIKYFSDRDEKKEEGFKAPPCTAENQKLGKCKKTDGFANMNYSDFKPTSTVKSAASVKSGFKDIGPYNPEANGIKVEGFAGLQGGPISETSGTMSFLRDNEASPTCPGYGYTKSTGNICMSAEDIRMLTTRGGNATGR